LVLRQAVARNYGQVLPAFSLQNQTATYSTLSVRGVLRAVTSRSLCRVKEAATTTSILFFSTTLLTIEKNIQAQEETEEQADQHLQQEFQKQCEGGDVSQIFRGLEGVKRRTLYLTTRN
jgi:hypothetical protein